MAAREERRGRPSDLTEEFQEQFLTRIRLRLGVERAAWNSGMNPRTVRAWLQRGREELETAVHSVSEPEPVEFGTGASRYGRFYIEYQKAAGMLEERWSLVLVQVLQTDEAGRRVADPEIGRLALNVLAAINPKKWGRKTHHYQKLDATLYLERLGAYERGDINPAAIHAQLARDRGRRDELTQLADSG